jgi:hypothetical protein
MNGSTRAQAQAPVAAATVAEQGVRWQQLSSAQRSALKPLEREWGGIDGTRKQKWIEIAGRFPTLPEAEQDRIQARMAEWAKMSPQQRGQARLNFQEANQVAPQDRRARWDAYQSLPAEQKRQLAAQAAAQAPRPAASGVRAPTLPRSGTADRIDAVQLKSNIVTTPSYAAPRKAVAPTVVQAQPGATTTSISKRPTPPSHQQTGLPKVAATPGLVDRETLLPQRGAQGAAALPIGNRPPPQSSSQ